MGFEQNKLSLRISLLSSTRKMGKLGKPHPSRQVMPNPSFVGFWETTLLMHKMYCRTQIPI